MRISAHGSCCIVGDCILCKILWDTLKPWISNDFKQQWVCKLSCIINGVWHYKNIYYKLLIYSNKQLYAYTVQICWKNRIL